MSTICVVCGKSLKVGRGLFFNASKYKDGFCSEECFKVEEAKTKQSEEYREKITDICNDIIESIQSVETAVPEPPVLNEEKFEELVSETFEETKPEPPALEPEALKGFIETPFIETVRLKYPEAKKPSEISDTLQERGGRYGRFLDQARITQSLKRAMKDSPNWGTLAEDQRECLEMVVHKIARILNGDPDFVDSWFDIEGYTKLVRVRLETGQSI